MLITQTPLRISLAGGGTDMEAYYKSGGGAVVSSAIDKYVYVIVNQRFDDLIVVGYTRKEIVESVDQIQHDLVREAMRKAGITKGIEVSTMADIPSAGSGLGSSSSVTVGLLNAFYAYRGIQVTAEQLAREACEIEIDICGKPIGKQDQYIAAYGGLRLFEFGPRGEVTSTELPIGRMRSDLGGRLSLFFTDMTRSADPILRKQQEGLCDTRGAMDQIKALAYTARDAIMDGKLDEIGGILNTNWDIKRGLAEGITNPAIDAMVACARSGGAAGCKICGAGGGGFLLTYCPKQDIDRLHRALSDYREMPFFLERFGSKVIFNVESYEWK